MKRSMRLFLLIAAALSPAYTAGAESISINSENGSQFLAMGGPASIVCYSASTDAVRVGRATRDGSSWRPLNISQAQKALRQRQDQVKLLLKRNALVPRQKRRLQAELLTLSKARTQLAGAQSSCVAALGAKQRRRSSSSSRLSSSSSSSTSSLAASSLSSASSSLSRFSSSAAQSSSSVVSSASSSAPACLSGTTQWTNVSFDPFTTRISARFKATPQQTGVDAVMGLSSGPGTGFSSFAATVRFSTGGLIEAKNGGGSYAAEIPMAYQPGIEYGFRLEADIVQHRYDVFVAAGGGAEQRLAAGYSFRTEQQSVTLLDNFGLYSSPSGTQLCALAISGSNQSSSSSVSSAAQSSFSSAAHSSSSQASSIALSSSSAPRSSSSSSSAALSSSSVSSPLSSSSSSLSSSRSSSSSSAPQSSSSSLASSSASSAPACLSATDVQWTNVSFTPATGRLTARFKAIAPQLGADAVMGLSSGAGTAFASYAATVRFSIAGLIEAKNGGAYAADISIAYQPGTEYSFRIEADIGQHIYDVFVAAGGGAEQRLALSYQFRPEQLTVASLDNFGIYSSPAGMQVCAFTASGTNLSSSSSSSSIAVQSSASSVSSAAQSSSSRSSSSSAASSVSSAQSSLSSASSASKSSAASSSSSSNGSINLGDLAVPAERLPYIDAYDSIPVDTSSWRVVNYTGAKTGAGVKATIESALPQTVIVLPAGDYSGEIIHRKSEVVLRGDCSDRSKVRWVHDSDSAGGGLWLLNRAGTARIEGCANGWISMCGAGPNDTEATLEMDHTGWLGPYTRNTLQLQLQSAAAYQVGDVILIESAPLSETDPAIGFSQWLTRLTYIAKVTAKSGNYITIDRPLPTTFSSLGAAVSRMKNLYHAGVECMTMVNTDAVNPSQSYTLAMRRAFESWVYNVDFGDTFGGWGGPVLTARSVFQSNRFGNQWKSTMGDGRTCNSTSIDTNPCWNKHTLTFDNTNDSSFINNVIDASIGFQPVNSASRNWVAYNYFPAPLLHPVDAERRRVIFFHGGYAHENLIEGNLFYGSMEMDDHWGSQGPNNVFFRNGEVNYGVEPGFITETQVYGIAAADAFRVARYTSWLLNMGEQFSLHIGPTGIDSRHDYAHLERNVYHQWLATGGPFSVGTTTNMNFNATSTDLGSAWDNLNFPSTLNRRVAGRVPAFWCRETVANGGSACEFDIKRHSIGALWDEHCKLPAQVQAEGGVCTPVGR